MKGMTDLVPPYQAWCDPETEPRLPLGTIGVCHVAEDACVARLVGIVHPREAWMPIVVAAPRLLHAALTPMLAELDRVSPGQFVHLGHEGRRAPRTTDVLHVVNQRPAVSPAILAQWLAARLQRPTLAVLISHVLEQPCSTPEGPSSRTLRRLVHDQLGCRPGDLIRLAHLATLRRLAPSLEALADEAETTVTRLRHRVQTGLGVSLHDYNGMPGWQWVLEAATRRGLGLGAGGWRLGAGRS